MPEADIWAGVCLEPGAIVSLSTDIEAAGVRPTRDAIVAIGAAVVVRDSRDNSIHIIDKFRQVAGFPGTSRFCPNTVAEFWSRGMPADPNYVPARDGLVPSMPLFAPLIYDGPLEEHAREDEMLHQYRAFVDKWFRACKAHPAKPKLVMTGDNPRFDDGWLSALLVQRGMPPLWNGPMRPDGSFPYVSFQDASDLASGFMIAAQSLLAPEHSLQNTDKTLSKYEWVELALGIAPCPVAHDHDPCNDASAIGWLHQAVLGVKAGVYRIVGA